MDLEDIKNELFIELGFARAIRQANALLAELQRAYKNDKRFWLKVLAITHKLNKESDEALPRIYEDYKSGKINKAQVLLQAQIIGDPRSAPDLRGLHRKKQIPPFQELLKEYNEICGRLRSKIKRFYRNPVAKEKDLQWVFEASGLNPSKGLVRKWVSVSLNKSNIALNVLADKYKASPSTIKKNVTMGRTAALLGLTPSSAKER